MESGVPAINPLSPPKNGIPGRGSPECRCAGARIRGIKFYFLSPRSRRESCCEKLTSNMRWGV